MSIFRLFKDGGLRHLGSSKFQIFNGQNGQESQTTSSCQISSKSIKPGPRLAIFRFLKMPAAATLGF